MKRTTHLLSLALLALLFTACKQTEFKKTKDGFPYKVYSSGKGEEIKPGYFVSVHRTSKINDSILETTYGNPPQFMPIPKDSSSGGSNELIKMLLEAREGDSIQINQPVDSILAKNPAAAQDSFIVSKKGKDLVTIFKVVQVYKTEEEAQSAFEKQNIEAYNKRPGVTEQRKKDEASIEEYLRANNIQAQRTPWGAYVQVVQQGTGPKPKYGQYMMLRYTGTDLTGKVFDTNNKPGAQLLPVQLGAGGSIIGFEDALKNLSEGAKANVYVPSFIGYGAEGRPPVIMPNQNLIFNIEVVDIADAPPAPSAPVMQDSTRR
ncbi:MAG: FKBP-type peptidyl-prolyl cis-trans isomerase [Bacteroidota bacterium]|nr:FKBP-type peptidyl-prolyl cis-trans isomerase [Bacteroidota bacterium]